jgi:DNA-directed RNA polymerase specialized sigma24 family protein
VLRLSYLALDRDERRALSLLAAGYSYREIGQLTDWTYTKVNRCVAEGRAALRGLAP